MICGKEVAPQSGSLREYATYLKEHPEEGEKLFDDVLIPGQRHEIHDGFGAARGRQAGRGAVGVVC